MITHSETQRQQAEKNIQEASLEIEASITELKAQLQEGLLKAHQSLEAIRSPLVVFGSAFVFGVFIGETLNSRFLGQKKVKI